MIKSGSSRAIIELDHKSNQTCYLDLTQRAFFHVNSITCFLLISSISNLSAPDAFFDIAVSVLLTGTFFYMFSLLPTASSRFSSFFIAYRVHCT